MSFGQFPLGVMPAAFEEENGTTDLDEKPLLGLEDPNSDEELDLERAEQKVWLVKVPRFLMEKWSAVQEEGVILGRVRVYDECVQRDSRRPAHARQTRQQRGAQDRGPAARGADALDFRHQGEVSHRRSRRPGAHRVQAHAPERQHEEHVPVRGEGGGGRRLW